MFSIHSLLFFVNFDAIAHYNIFLKLCNNVGCVHFMVYGWDVLPLPQKKYIYASKIFFFALVISLPISVSPLLVVTILQKGPQF